MKKFAIPFLKIQIFSYIIKKVRFVDVIDVVQPTNVSEYLTWSLDSCTELSSLETWGLIILRVTPRKIS